MKRKILSVILAIVMIIGFMPSMAFANGDNTGQTTALVTGMGAGGEEPQNSSGDNLTDADGGNEAETQTLEQMVYAANENGTITLGNGSYLIPSSVEQGATVPSGLTISGNGADNTIVHVTGIAPGESSATYFFDGGKTVTFENLTINFGNVTDYDGFVRARNMTFNNVTIKGMGSNWGSGDVKFEDCKFVYPDEGYNKRTYNLWTYSGSSFTFNNCMFVAKLGGGNTENPANGKFINVYNQADSSTEVGITLTNCKFETEEATGTTAEPGKPIIKIGNGSAWNISVTNADIDGAKAATYECTKSNLYGSDAGEGILNNTKCTVTIDGKVVWEKGAQHTHTSGEPVHENEVAASCTTIGSYDEVVYCSVCQTEISRETKTVDKLAHKIVKTEAKAATYSEKGNLAYWFCEVCHKYFKDENASEEYAENGWVIAKLKKSSSSSSSSTTTKTDTTTNKDGSTTTTETKSDGTKVETTTNTDGSTTTTETKTETKTDGSAVTTEVKTETKTDGTKTEVTSEVTTAKDGTTTKTETAKTTDASGSTGTTTTVTDASGATTVTAEATVSEKAVETAQKENTVVTVPVEVKATTDVKTAPTVEIKIEVKSGGSSDRANTVKVEIPVTNVDSGTVAVIVKADGTEEIVKTTIPTENGVTISVSGDVTVKIVDNSKTFTDTTSHWSKDEVNFVASRGLFNGVGGGDFGVKEPMTRGMVNTVLARLAGENTDGGEDWYDKGNEWAVKNGVSDGTNPTASVTREQLATMLYRYAGAPEVTGDISFVDSSAISEYAQKALIWATQNGIINGMGDGTIAPSADAERAQVAAMMARFLKKL